MFVFLSIALLTFGVTCFATYILVRFSGRFRIIDYPNERSLHSIPTPRTGGLAIWIGALAGVAISLPFVDTRQEVVWIGSSALAIGMVSMTDDWLRVEIATRLIVHIAASSLLVIGGLGMYSISIPGAKVYLATWVAVPAGILFSVWMTNLYNFMDGMDGFATGMTIVGFGTFAILGVLASEPLFVALNVAVAAAAGGFLVFNFPPARIFMGDVGSSTIGFLGAAFILWAERYDIFPFWVGLLIFSPFVVDATVTLVRRIMRHDRIWLPHKSHHYQRLVQLGWSHRKTTLAGYGLMFVSAVSAAIGMRLPSFAQWILLGLWCVGYIVLASWISLIGKSAD